MKASVVVIYYVVQLLMDTHPEHILIHRYECCAGSLQSAAGAKKKQLLNLPTNHAAAGALMLSQLLSLLPIPPCSDSTRLAHVHSHGHAWVSVTASAAAAAAAASLSLPLLLLVIVTSLLQMGHVCSQSQQGQLCTPCTVQASSSWPDGNTP